MRARVPPIIASRLSALISIKAPHPRRGPVTARATSEAIVLAASARTAFFVTPVRDLAFGSLEP